MARPKQSEQVTARMLAWLDEVYPNRGRFAALEVDSSIPAQRWKNFYYGRQGITQEMLVFLAKTDPKAHAYVTTGVRPEQLEQQASFIRPSPTDQATIGSRLKWVIRQWAGPARADLFAHLERKSKNTVSAAAWASFYIENIEPTPAMITASCRELPQYVEWVLYGRVSDSLQMDPSHSSQLPKASRAP